MDKVMRRKWYFYINQKGISLAEILITLAIVGLLTTIGLPYYQKSKRKAMQVEAKTLLVKIYASERAFIGEWGYGTPNFHQLGFSPSGNVFYNAGWSDNSSENMKSGSVDINNVYDDSIHERKNGKVNALDPIKGYEGPYLPSDLSKGQGPYDSLTLTSNDLKNFTNVKELCKGSNFKDEAPCIFNPSASTKFDIAAKLGTHDININNDTDPDTAPGDDVKFKIGARGYFEGSPHSDEWVIDENGNLKNVQIGL